MKRKIAAIFAADIAGYSRLVAEDEEETLRRLQAYRAVTDDFIASVVDRWLAATPAASQVTRLSPPGAFQGAVGAVVSKSPIATKVSIWFLPLTVRFIWSVSGPSVPVEAL